MEVAAIAAALKAAMKAITSTDFILTLLSVVDTVASLPYNHPIGW